MHILYPKIILTSGNLFLLVGVFLLGFRLNAQTLNDKEQKNAHRIGSLGVLPTEVSNDSFLRSILVNPDYRVQIIISPKGKDDFQHEISFPLPVIQDQKVVPPDYFYPASLVKLPIVIATLNKLNELSLPNWDKYYITHGATGPCQTPVPLKKRGSRYYHPPLIKDYIKQICLISDNDAYSRLYEFCGQTYINQKLQNWGYEEARIIQRFALCNYYQNKATNPVSIYLKSGNRYQLVHHQKQQTSDINMTNPHPDTQIGNRYFMNGKYHQGPMDFRLYNNLPLTDIHDQFRRLINYDQIGINKVQTDSLVKWFGLSPRESNMGYQRYPNLFIDSFKKYLYYGTQEKHIGPDSLRIVNIVGQSHGWLSESALLGNVIVSVVIYCDKDGCVGDGNYTTNSVGMPFLRQLGKKLYSHYNK